MIPDLEATARDMEQMPSCADCRFYDECDEEAITLFGGCWYHEPAPEVYGEAQA